MVGLYVKNGITGVQFIKLIRQSLVSIKRIDDINNMSYDEFNDFMSGFKFVVIGGGKYNLDLEEMIENMHITANIDIIKYCEKHNIPVFGLGFGCQLIALMYGMKINKIKEPHIGPNFITVDDVKNGTVKDDEFMKNFDWDMLVKSFSYDLNIIVDTEDEHDIDVMVRTTKGIPYVIKHKNKPMYGIQSHPDLDSMTGLIFLNSFNIKTKMARELLNNNETYFKISTQFTNELLKAFSKIEK